MPDVTWTTEQDGAALRVLLSGEITETSDFEPLLKQVRSAVVLDLAGINRINSCGLREWLNFVRELGQRADSIAFERCSPAVVQQLNMISNFCGGGTVKSILAPYCCPSCDQIEDRLFELSAEDIQLPETLKCSNCPGEMEFDDILTTYLSFRQR